MMIWIADGLRNGLRFIANLLTRLGLSSRAAAAAQAAKLGLL